MFIYCKVTFVNDQLCGLPYGANWELSFTVELLRKTQQWGWKSHPLTQSYIWITWGKGRVVVTSNHNGSGGRAGALVTTVMKALYNYRGPRNFVNGLGQDN